jgi:hypothetical protein
MVAGRRNQASYLNHEGLLDSSNPFFLRLGAATRRSLVQIQPDSQASCLIHKGLLDSSSPPLFATLGQSGAEIILSLAIIPSG